MGRFREFLSGRFTTGQARVLCYALGPFSAVLMLYSGKYGAIWSVRFHACHSILMGAIWVAAWSALRLVQEISPWFLATLAQEARFALNLCSLIVWACLLFTAYYGWRCAIIPYLHSLAVRFSRRYERRYSVRAANGFA